MTVLSRLRWLPLEPSHREGMRGSPHPPTVKPASPRRHTAAHPCPRQQHPLLVAGPPGPSTHCHPPVIPLQAPPPLTHCPPPAILRAQPITPDTLATQLTQGLPATRLATRVPPATPVAPVKAETRRGPLPRLARARWRGEPSGWSRAGRSGRPPAEPLGPRQAILPTTSLCGRHTGARRQRLLGRARDTTTRALLFMVTQTTSGSPIFLTRCGPTSQRRSTRKLQCSCLISSRPPSPPGWAPLICTSSSWGAPRPH
mmetsp:Transcript_17162/g.51353  ORF Transcript_17162/g.51353 Transcript_17162/m.51353 type:complete len:257 (-) Transcript_17162:1745-2515(-)